MEAPAPATLLSLPQLTHRSLWQGPNNKLTEEEKTQEHGLHMALHGSQELAGS